MLNYFRTEVWVGGVPLDIVSTWVLDLCIDPGSLDRCMKCCGVMMNLCLQQLKHSYLIHLHLTGKHNYNFVWFWDVWSLNNHHVSSNVDIPLVTNLFGLMVRCPEKKYISSNVEMLTNSYCRVWFNLCCCQQVLSRNNTISICNILRRQEKDRITALFEFGR